MLDLIKVTQDIEKWIIDFVEVPHPALGGWPPCPYARKARLTNDYNIRIGNNPYIDLMALSVNGLDGKSVVVLVYDPVQWAHDVFSQQLKDANTHCLLRKDLLALEDHPGDPEIVNGISMNQGTYALALVQSLGDLDAKAKAMAVKGFYDQWPEEYLQELFQHRQDPRL
jgi:hypothetical protein